MNSSPQASVAGFLTALRQFNLVEKAKLDKPAASAGKYPDPKALATDMVQKGLLTPYQANQLLQGKGAELVLGNYILLEKLGEGGMGQVFKAKQSAMGRLVALKVIHKEKANNLKAIQRFKREIQAASKLNHRNIVLALASEEVNGRLILVMEFVEGSDLHRIVEKKGPLPIGAACSYIAQAAMGLQHAMEKGLVHRDIKPQNLLLSNDSVVKILDMGLARAAEAGQYTTLTVEGSVLGTPDYLAPEQAMSSHTADIRADIYSLGATFYYLLTGSVLFPGGSLAEKLIKHQMAEPVPVKELRPEIPDQVVAVLKKMLAKKPEDRFQTPAEVAAALRTIGNKVTRPPRERKKRARLLPFAIAAGLLMAMTVGAAVLLNGPPPTDKDERAQASEKQVPTGKGGSGGIPGPKSVSVDLLKLIDPQKNSVAGIWQRDNNAIVLSQSAPRAWSLIHIPYTAPEEYDLEMELTRPQGEEAISIALPIGGRRCNVTFDAFTQIGGRAGLEFVDGKRVDNNETTFNHTTVPQRVPKAIICSVRKKHIVVVVNGIPTIYWAGDPIKLSSMWTASSQGNLTIGCWETQIRLNKLVIKRIANTISEQKQKEWLKSADGYYFVTSWFDHSWHMRIAEDSRWKIVGDNLIADPPDGSRITLRFMDDQNTLVGVHQFPKDRWTWIARRLKQPPSPSVFLADLQESVSGGLKFAKKEDKSEPSRFVVDGKKTPNGILMHPFPQDEMRVSYNLGKRYSLLYFAAGISDSAQGMSASPLIFSVVTDGRIRWASRPLEQHGKSQNWSISVEGVEKLELSAKCTGNDNRRAYGIWVDPCLVPKMQYHQPSQER